MLIEYGNEVWAAAYGLAEIGANYTVYGNWARSAATIMKATPGYNADKIKLCYSGRAPEYNGGINAKMLTGDKGEVDDMSISGYFGSTLKIDPNTPLETTQLNYHKASIAELQNSFNGLTNTLKESFGITGRILPMYLYEGNMTQSSYYGRLGQAITFADYYSSMPLYGVPNVGIFLLNGGEWRMIKDEVNYQKMPLFYVGKCINKYCTGNMLETKFTSATKIYDGAKELTIYPVGCKAYTDSTSYSVAMFSRDFEHDYVVQLDIPDNVGNGAT